MVSTLLGLAAQVIALVRARRIGLAELAGTAAAVAAFVSWFGGAAGWLVAAVALFAKSLAWERQQRAGRD